ncbi:MAG: IS630 family transposase, partial [Proteobacteria bacterium]|nr:IS630 family transposase [Pseudomonadota bacterium]
MPTPAKREKLTLFGCLNLRTKRFYWKKSKHGDAESLIWFFTQLRQRFGKRHLVIILDNASIHISKKIRKYLQRFPFIHLFFLPPYSPEYNPVERVWGWIKQKVYGFKAFGGIQYLIKKFRTFIWHFNR